MQVMRRHNIAGFAVDLWPRLKPMIYGLRVGSGERGGNDTRREL